MLDGLYSAASGLMAQQERMDSVSNDIANVNTTGYKSARVAFRDLTYLSPGAGSSTGVRTGSGAAAWTMGRSAEQGALQRTGNALDLAIEGNGYFHVRTAAGRDALTRDGSFTLNADHELVTAQGARLVPPVRVPRDVAAEDIHIGKDGAVSGGDGKRFGRIEVVDVPAPDGLQPTGDNLLTPSAASGAIRRADGRLEQGALEGSNVDISDSMVDMMDAQKSFSLASQAVKMQDQAMEIANGIKR